MPITTLDELKSYYPARLIMQYRGKTRWTQLIQALVQEAWLDGMVQVESDCFDLETAVGAQLDVIGRIVGVNRNVYGLDLAHTFFELTTYDGSPSGINMQVYKDNTPGPEIMLTYRTDAVYTMSESEMRALIKLKIVHNNADRTTKDLVDALQLMFGNLVIFSDNRDLSVTYYINETLWNVFIIANFLGIIPRPMGVSVNVLQIVNVLDDDGNNILDDSGNTVSA